MSHFLLPVNAGLTLHVLLRSGSNTPLISIREIDMKLLRAAVAGGAKKSAASTAAASLNEQAARVKARQLMLSYATALMDATKDEIRWLKESGVLGKRAPKSSLMSATHLLALLRENNKTVLASTIQNALINHKVGEWEGQVLAEVNPEEAAAEEAALLAAAEEAAAHAQEEEEAAAAAAAASMAAAAADEDGTYGDGGASSRRRRTPSMKRKNQSGDDDEAPDDPQDEDFNNGRRTSKRTRKSNQQSDFSSYRSPSLLAAAAGAVQSPFGLNIGISGNIDPGAFQLNSPRSKHKSRLDAQNPPPGMDESRAMLMLNPKDRSTLAARSATPFIQFGADRTATIQVMASDPCTIVGPFRGAGTARATHGITSGSWYIEVKGTSQAVSAMNAIASTATSDPSASAASVAAAASSAPIDSDAPPHCRIGFAASASRIEGKLLGHDDLSYAYGDRYGDKIHEGEADVYGESFAIFPNDENVEGDVIGMLIELGVAKDSFTNTLSGESGSSPTHQDTGNRISFYKNNQPQGIAWSNLPAGYTWFPSATLINGMAVTFNFQVSNANDSNGGNGNGNGAASQERSTATENGYSQQQPRTMLSPSASSSSLSLLKQESQMSGYSASSAAASSSSASSSAMMQPMTHMQIKLEEHHNNGITSRSISNTEFSAFQYQSQHPHAPYHSSAPQPQHANSVDLSHAERLAQLQEFKNNVHQQHQQQHMIMQQRQQEQAMRAAQHQQQQSAAAAAAMAGLAASSSSPSLTVSANRLAPGSGSSSTSSAAYHSVHHTHPQHHNHLRVPDELAMNIPAAGGVLLQQSPSASPSFPLISPAPSPLPLLSTSLSTTPLPNMDEQQSALFSSMNYTGPASPMLP